MTVDKLMQTSVMTVDPQAPLKNVARILSEFRISGLPVVDGGGAVVGVVSETDILFKEVGGESKRRRLLDRVFASRRSSRRKADAKPPGMR